MSHDKHPPKLEYLEFFKTDRPSGQLIVQFPIAFDPECPEMKTAYDTVLNFLVDGNRVLPAKYCSIFEFLIELEDAYTHNQIDEGNIFQRKVSKDGDDFYIEIIEETHNIVVPNCIAEGDKLLIRTIEPESESNDDSKLCSILKINENKICFKKPDGRKVIENGKIYSFSFMKDRTVFYTEMLALNKLDLWTIANVLFPKRFGTHRRFEFPTEDFDGWFSKSISSNPEQQQAIFHILNRTAFPAPYIIFGPPGTGKTTTLIEAVLQIWKHKPKSNILITAPTNSACNDMTSALLNKITSESAAVFRLFAINQLKKIDKVDPAVVQISNLSTGEYQIPTVQFLSERRIIICTLSTSRRLYYLKTNHFKYIFIDEAGSATEPSALVPIARFMSDGENMKTNLVLAGDPLQLGPVLQCRHAEQLGLGTSLLERLMQLDMYKPDKNMKYNAKVLTKLLQNYRSNEEILSFSNEYFYNNELIPKAKIEITNMALGWSDLVNKNIPFIFHHTSGTFKRDATTYSLSNREEVNLVLSYTNNFLIHGINGKKILPSQIGIISPYRKQCELLSKRIKPKYVGVEIGTVEHFQGQEKEIIIISTVRSCTDNIGFLNNPKRLNVSITRAKSLLIIIGDQFTLCRDYYWKCLLSHYHSKGAVLFDPSSIQTNKNFKKPFKNVHLKNAIPSTSVQKLDFHAFQKENIDKTHSGDVGDQNSITFSQSVQNETIVPSLIQKPIEETFMIYQSKLIDEINSVVEKISTDPTLTLESSESSDSSEPDMEETNLIVETLSELEDRNSPIFRFTQEPNLNLDSFEAIEERLCLKKFKIIKKHENSLESDSDEKFLDKDLVEQTESSEHSQDSMNEPCLVVKTVSELEDLDFPIMTFARKLDPTIDPIEAVEQSICLKKFKIIKDDISLENSESDSCKSQNHVDQKSFIKNHVFELEEKFNDFDSDSTSNSSDIPFYCQPTEALKYNSFNQLDDSMEDETIFSNIASDIQFNSFHSDSVKENLIEILVKETEIEAVDVSSDHAVLNLPEKSVVSLLNFEYKSLMEEHDPSNTLISCCSDLKTNDAAEEVNELKPEVGEEAIDDSESFQHLTSKDSLSENSDESKFFEVVLTETEPKKEPSESALNSCTGMNVTPKSTVWRRLSKSLFNNFLGDKK